MEKVWLKSYPENVPHEIDPKEYSSIIEMFEESCEKYKDRCAFTNMGSEISYNELDKLSKDFAAFLQSKGIKKGDRVVLQMPNLLQFPIALFGALRAGAIIVNTNPLYTAREMEHQFKDSGATAIVILANFAHMLEEIIDKTEIETVVVTEIGDLLGWPKSLLVNSIIKYVKKMVPKYKLPQAISFYEALDIGEANTFSPQTLCLEDTAFLQYTGGTTGVSKGAELTHANICANMLQISYWMEGELIAGKESIVTALPLYHIFSLTVNCLALMRNGATNILITNPKDIPAFIKTLKTTHFTILTGVNTLFNALMNHPQFTNIDFSKLKVSVAGGMALQASVSKRWCKLTDSKLIEGFGLTETSPVVCCNPLNGEDRVGTIGMPLPSTEIKIIDENGNDIDDEEQSGELCVRGPQVMKGYWNRPDETKSILGEDGWLKTGDIAQIMYDGYCKIVDRKKDMILVSGFNVYPNEVEDVIAKHDKVIEVAAIGVPDDKSGEAVKVFIVTNGELTKEELIEFCREDLVAYKVPRYVEFRDELPKTNVGKTLRRALRENN